MQSPLYSATLALRSLVRARGMSVVAILTLGIGLSATVALLGVVDSGIRALPVPNGADVVELDVRDARGQRVTPPAPVDRWAPGTGVVEAGALRQMQATLAHATAPATRLTGAAMQTAVFRLLQVQPAIGRLPTDDAMDGGAVLLGWDAYQQLGARPSIVGTSLRVDGINHVIVGVMPDGFGFPEKQSFWTVLPRGESGEVVARLTHGADPDAVGSGVGARLAALRDPSLIESTSHGNLRVAVQPWTRSRDNGGEGAIFGALAVLVTLLLIVCASNVATLLLVRANERASSLAIHSALGASRLAVAYQLLLEATLIAAGGGIVGLAGGFSLLHWMQTHLAQHWGYYWMRMEVRPGVVASTFAVVMLTAVVAGIAPAWKASRIDLSRVLAGAGRGRYDVRQRLLGRWFVGAQVALSTIGLIAAAFMAWGSSQFGKITSLLPMDQVAVASIALPDGRYVDAATQSALITRLQQELRRIPGAENVTLSSAIPGGGAGSAELAISGTTAPDGTKPANVGWFAADAGILSTYGMRLVAGRAFNANDGDGRPVAIVTPAFARQRLTGPPLGQMIRLKGVHGDDEWAEIIGVANDWFPEGMSAKTDRVFIPLAAAFPRELYVSIRATTPGDVLPAVRTAVARVDHDLPVSDLQTLRDRMDWFLRMSRVIAAFGILGGIGSAAVAAIGLYGVMSFQVRSQIREIGVRMAIGAASSRVMRDVVRESLIRVAPGLLVGMALGLAAVPVLSRFMQGGTQPPALLLLAGVCISMIAIGVTAALEPALRAARLSPQVVLRQD